MQLSFRYNAPYLGATEAASLSEMLTQFDKVILHKSHTNAGLTTFFLKRDISSLIITPNVGQVRDKERAYKEGTLQLPENTVVLFIYSNSSDKLRHLDQYLLEGKVVHVYLCFARGKSEYSKEYLLTLADRFLLVVDEYHAINDRAYMEHQEDITDIINAFPKVILTSATPLAIQTFDYPIVDIINESRIQEQIEFVRIKSLQQAQRIILADHLSNPTKHILYGTNSAAIHKFIGDKTDLDIICGTNVRNKVAKYVGSDEYSSFDTNKHIHGYTASGFEGVDFDEDVETVYLVGSYTDNEATKAFRFTHNDMVQAFGRARKKRCRLVMLYVMSQGYEQQIVNGVASAEEVEEIEQGLVDWYNFTESIAYKGVVVPLLYDIIQFGPQTSMMEKIETIEQHSYFRDVIEELPDHVSLDRVTNKDRDNRRDRQSGMNATEAIVFSMASIIHRSHATNQMETILANTPINRQEARIKKSLFKALSVAYHKHNFMKDIISPDAVAPDAGNIRLNVFEHKIVQKIVDYIRTNDGCRWTLADPRRGYLFDNEYYKVMRARKEMTSYIDFLMFYNLGKSTDLYKASKESAVSYLKSDLYKLKVSKGGQLLTVDKIMKDHRRYHLEQWLAFRGALEKVEMVRGHRTFHQMAMQTRPLRKHSIFIVQEMDIKSAYPYVAAYKNDPEFLKRIEAGKVYEIEGKTRDEAKVVVNRAFNLSSATTHNREDYIGQLMEAGFTAVGAAKHADDFSKKSSFYNYATGIEVNIINQMRERLEVLQSPMYRLHDALWVFGSQDLSSYATEPIREDGNNYYFSTK